MSVTITVDRLTRSSKDWLIVYNEQNTSASQVTDLVCCHGNYTAISLATNVYGWLGQIGMGAYASLLENNGYDSLTYCNLLDEETLGEIGITSVDDRR